MFLHIALSVPTISELDYLPCEGLEPSQLRPGMRFLVPLGSRKIIGLLVETTTTTTCPAEKLKSVIKALDSKPVIDSVLFNLCRKAATYYHRSLGEMLFLALPVLLRKHRVIPVNKQCFWTLNKDISAADIRACTKKQQLTIGILQQHNGKASDSTLKEGGIAQKTLNKMAEKNLIFSTDDVMTYNDFRTVQPVINNKPLTLNKEQSVALEEIKKHLQHFFPILLYGVTGSGKTEVYLQAIEEVLIQKKQVLVLVPEIGLTPQMLSRFQRRFNVPVVTLHSGMDDNERYYNWIKAWQLKAGIIISTRSGIFCRLPEPGLIIIDEEHDLSYKQQDGIRYSARDLALLRGQLSNIPVILGSATPSLESVKKANSGHYLMLNLTHRAGGAKMPQFRLIDIRSQPLHAGLSQQVIKSIKQTIDKKQQVLVFINRRGFAPSLICTHCGYVINCQYCDSCMTLHRTPPHLHCHHCDYQQAVPASCPECHAETLNATGTGTERTEMFLQETFPETDVLRIDRDSTRLKNSFNKILDTINSQKPAILVGTQMIAKGHHFPAVTLVIIINLDAGFFNADFRGEEKTAQLLLQVAGRAGRGEVTGQVLLQTYNPDNPDLIMLIQKEYMAFAMHQLSQRQHLHLPPYSYLALFTVDSLCMKTTQGQLKHIAGQIRQHQHNFGPLLKVIGPMPAPMEKRQGRFREQLLFCAEKRSVLHFFLSWFRQQLNNFSHTKQCRWILDIDPQEMI